MSGFSATCFKTYSRTPLLLPSERKIRGAEPRLAYAVRKEDQTVLRLHLKGIRGHGPVPVFRRSEFTPVDLQRFSPAQQNEFRIAHFHNAGESAETRIDDGERHIADMPHPADGKSVHDDFRGVDDLTVLRDETQRHGRGHQRQDIRLDPVSESVRHDRQQPFFRYDAFERNRIAAGFSSK